jgi:hypothetical protein
LVANLGGSVASFPLPLLFSPSPLFFLSSLFCSLVFPQGFFS